MVLAAVVPILKLAGFTLRSAMPAGDIAVVEADQPGFTDTKLLDAQEELYSRLRKRYAVPFGTQAPTLASDTPGSPPVILGGVPSVGTVLISLQATTSGPLATFLFQWSEDGGKTWNLGATPTAAGTAPPTVTLTGTSNLALPSLLRLRFTIGGALGTAAFEFSTDGGVTWSAPIVTAAAVVLGATGMSALFPAGPYNVDNTYQAIGIVSAAQYVLGDTGLTVDFGVGAYVALQSWAAPYPVPRICFVWLTRMVTPELYRKRGVNPQDPAIIDIEKDLARAEAAIEEAANSEVGLYDLPLADNTNATGISAGGPRVYTETSPYVWTDVEANQASLEDSAGRGTGS